MPYRKRDLLILKIFLTKEYPFVCSPLEGIPKIKSLGFNPENLPKLFNAEELAISQWGTIKIDLKSMQTNLDGVFAAGDIVRGASLVVWAIRDGRDVAESIKKFLEQKELKASKVA